MAELKMNGAWRYCAADDCPWFGPKCSLSITEDVKREAHESGLEIIPRDPCANYYVKNEKPEKRRR